MADITAPTYGETDERLKPVKENNTGLLKKALGGLDLGGFDPEAYGSLVQQQAEAAGEVAKGEARQRNIAAKGKADAEQAFATGLREQYKAAEPTLMSAPPKFNVTKDTQEGLTGLAALMTVGSLIIGSKGSTAGVNAMNAMTGVLKGYQEGNQQRIDFETKKYEQSIKEWERALQQTKESLSRYEKLATADLGAATSQAAAAAAAEGQTVIAAKIKQEGLSQTRAMVDKLIQQTVSSKLMPVLDKDTGQQTYATEAQIRQNPNKYQAAPTGRAATQTSSASEAISTNAQAIANYSIAPPGRNNRNRDQIMAEVMAVNPAYKEGDYGNQNIALRNWTNPNGAGFKQIGAFNTVSGHLETLNKLATALDNGDIPSVNALVNYVKRATGDAAVTNYDTAKQAVAGELVKAVTGVAGALADREEAAANLLRNGSPKQQEEAIETWKELIAGRLETAMYQFKSGTGRSENEFLQLLPPATREYFAGYAGVKPAPRAPANTTTSSSPRYNVGQEVSQGGKTYTIKEVSEDGTRILRVE